MTGLHIGAGLELPLDIVTVTGGQVRADGTLFLGGDA